MTAVRLESVHVSFGGVQVLRDVNCEVSDGRVLGIVGPNGCGKTTLLRVLFRGLRPDSGQVWLGGEKLAALSRRQVARRVAVVAQEVDWPLGMTVQQCVELGRLPHQGVWGSRRAKSAADDVVNTSMERCGVFPHRNQRVSTLSGGWRQRVAIAAALAQQPHVLLLDEVTNHLDVRARFEVLQLVRDLAVTTISVIHELDLAVRYCDQLLALQTITAGSNDQRSVVADGGPSTVLTPRVLHEVFGVNARAHPLGVDFDANPLAD